MRLTVDGETWETPVEVGVDPLVPASGEDLAAQHETALKLTDMQSAANDVLRGMDAVKEQLAARRAAAKTMKKELPEELEKKAKAFAKDLQELQDGLARPEGATRWSQGPRLSERLSQLFRNVDTAFRAPTAAQVEYLGELEGELAGAVEAWDVVLGEHLPELNAALVEAGIPVVAVPEKMAPSPEDDM